MDEQDVYHKLVQAVRNLTLKTFSKTFFSDATNAKGIVQIDDITKFEQSYPFKVAHGVMEVFTRNNVYVVVANASTSVIELAKQQRIATTIPSPSKVLHIKNDEYYPYLPPSSAVDSVKVVRYESNPAACNKWRST